MAFSYGRTPDNMKKAVYMAELILPGKPAYMEISEASITITFNFFSQIIARIFFGISLLKSSTFLQVLFKSKMEPGRHDYTNMVWYLFQYDYYEIAVKSEAYT